MSNQNKEENLDRATAHREGPDIVRTFQELILEIGRPKVLELGSRDVHGTPLRDFIFGDVAVDYTGFDFHAGPNVDVVGDAHALAQHFDEGSFDAIISTSVFEHLAMPWKVVLECNTVLETAGFVFINTLQSYPLHERPWDFFRFSDHAWKVLFNQWTGFEIVATELNTPCQIVPDGPLPAGWATPHQAYVNSNVLARKVGDYDRDRLRWDLDAGELLQDGYPEPA